MSAQLQEVAFFSFHSKVFKEVLFLYFTSLVSSWAGWLWASQEIAAAALPCAALARAVPAACRGCSAPAAGGTGGVGAPCIPQLPPAGASGTFVVMSSEFTQPCKEDAVLPREVWSSCVGLSGWHQSRFLSKESKAQSSHFFSFF